MNTSIISGLIGGLISVVLLTFLSARIRGKACNGQLKYGWGILLLGFVCLVIAGIAVYAYFHDPGAREKPGELYSIIGLFFGFGLGAIYSFGEYFKVYGTFDKNSINFHTPWTGVKKEKWADLKSATFNPSLNWYVLKFKSGKTIRLSNLLGGHGEVLQILQDKGYDL